MTPAIITETLYALVKEQDFVPDEVHVITTLEGQEKVRRLLLAPKTGHFHAFLRDHLPGRSIRFDDSTVHLIGQDEHGQGTALADIQDGDDNRQAAHTIYRVLRQLKTEWPTQLHASVAGGRKSMSFYMGQAFSLVAEPGDRLSHVLVNEPFETVQDFFYPPPQPRLFTTRDGKKVSSVDARVQLADLSVIQLGPMLGDLPPKAQTSLDFAIQIAQAVVSPPAVRLVWNKMEDSGQVEMLGEVIPLPRQKFVMLALHAIARQELCATDDDEEAGAFLIEDRCASSCFAMTSMARRSPPCRAGSRWSWPRTSGRRRPGSGSGPSAPSAGATSAPAGWRSIRST
jgi:CRISPR-associated protein (TIGR02584 family)